MYLHPCRCIIKQNSARLRPPGIAGAGSRNWTGLPSCPHSQKPGRGETRHGACMGTVAGGVFMASSLLVGVRSCPRMVRQKGRFNAWPCEACGSWAPFRRTDNFAIELLSWAAAESTEPSGSGPTISAIPAYWRPLVCSPSVCVALCRGPAKQPSLVWMERAELCGGFKKCPPAKVGR